MSCFKTFSISLILFFTITAISSTVKGRLLIVNKIFSFVLVIIALANFWFYITGKMDSLVFWIILGILALATYAIIPALKTKLDK